MTAQERHEFLSRANKDGRRHKAMQYVYQAAFESLHPEMEADPEYPFLLAQHSAALLSYAARNVLAAPRP